MNKDEAIANDFLKKNFVGLLKYEPNGNIPPDFSLEGKIGIEVRRLNKNFCVNGVNEGLESLAHNIHNRLTRILKELDDKESSYSYFIWLRFKRPLFLDKMLNKKMKCAILGANLQTDSRVEIPIDTNLTLQLQRSNKRFITKFKLVSIYDGDRGGLLVQDLYDNLKIAISDKNEKISPHFNEFEKWWLVLIDRIDGNLDDTDIKQLLELPKPETYFEIIYIVSSQSDHYIKYK